MIHARKEYAHIQDPSRQIPANMPVLLLLAQDKHFNSTLGYYLQLIQEDPMCDSRLVEQLEWQTQRGQDWEREHGVKAPDTPTQWEAPVTEAVLIDRLRSVYPRYVLMQVTHGFSVKVPEYVPGKPSLVWTAITGVCPTWQEAASLAYTQGSRANAQNVVRQSDHDATDEEEVLAYWETNMSVRKPCEVAAPGCEASTIEQSAKHRCYQCGCPVCGNCSSMQRTNVIGRSSDRMMNVRLCNTCRDKAR